MFIIIIIIIEVSLQRAPTKTVSELNTYLPKSQESLIHQAIIYCIPGTVLGFGSIDLRKTLRGLPLYDFSLL